MIRDIYEEMVKEGCSLHGLMEKDAVSKQWIAGKLMRHSDKMDDAAMIATRLGRDFDASAMSASASKALRLARNVGEYSRSGLKKRVRDANLQFRAGHYGKGRNVDALKYLATDTERGMRGASVASGRRYQ